MRLRMRLEAPASDRLLRKRSTAAITSLTVDTISGSNLVAGTAAYLYAS